MTPVPPSSSPDVRLSGWASEDADISKERRAREERASEGVMEEEGRTVREKAHEKSAGVVGRKGEAEYPGVGNLWLDRCAARMALRTGKVQQLAMTARWGRVEHVSLGAP